MVILEISTLVLEYDEVKSIYFKNEVKMINFQSRYECL